MQLSFTIELEFLKIFLCKTYLLGYIADVIS